MLLNYRLFFLTTLVIISLGFNKLHSQETIPTDSIKPYCDGANVEEFIENNKIESLEIKTNNTKKWSRNILNTMLDLNSAKERSEHEDWFSFRINKDYKKKFKSIIIVKFKDKNFTCKFKARIRITGDLWWHLDWINGNPISSLHVEITNGHINSITKFKLFLPKSRFYENEIFTSLILKEVGFLAPRTFMTEAKINGTKINYIFQEDLRKEFLENLMLREGPILEGDERFTIMLSDDNGEHPEINLSRIVNKKFSLKNETNAKTALWSVSNLNLLYLQHHQTQKKIQGDKLHINSDRFFKEKKQRRNHEIYEALIYALDAQHHLSYDDRRFYFDSIEQIFLPIYYDGKSKIINQSQFLSNEELKKKVSIDAKNGSQNAMNLINNIDHSIFIKKLNNSGFYIKKEKYENLIKKIIDRLTIIKSSDPVKINYLDTETYFPTLKSDKFIDKKLVFVNFKDKKFNICNFSLNECKIIKNKNYEFKKLLADVISQEFKIFNNKEKNKKDYIFVFTDMNYPNAKFLNHSIWSQKAISEKTIIKYNKNIILDINHDAKTLRIKQTSKDGRAIISKGKIENWNIFFEGFDLNVNNNLYSSHFNLTGCLTFHDIEIKNLEITSINGNCEDSINFIRARGDLKSVSIENSLSDALDVDFSKLHIYYANIKIAKNDCMDFSYGNYVIEKIEAEQCGDKGISTGEKSNVKIKDVKINHSNIAVAVKDSSYMEINNSEIYNSSLCFAAYRKKQEFVGARIKIKNTNCDEDKFYSNKGSKIF